MTSHYEILSGLFDDIKVRGPVDALPIVFVHEAGISKQMWHPQLASLSDDYRVVAFDLPEHGMQSEMSFEFEAAVSDLEEIILQGLYVCPFCRAGRGQSW